MSIEDKSIDSLEDIAKYTPNLMLYNTGQEGLIVPSIRGISGNVLSYSTPVGCMLMEFLLLVLLVLMMQLVILKE